MRDCKGICSRFKSQEITRPIYKHHRRCTKCECYYGKKELVCKCCHCQTRGRPYNRKWKEKYKPLSYS